MRSSEVIDELRSLADPAGREGMARFGINPDHALGIRIPVLRALAKRMGTDHGLAADLWASGIHEARLLACLVDVPAEVTEEQMESWAAGFDSWDLVDQCCGNLFVRTPFAWGKAVEWSEREEEFVKRAGFSLMAMLAVHDRKASDPEFESLFPIIEREAGDPRNFVRKAVNWALRQIGKRNARLHGEAMRAAERILATGPRPARWVASDALRELRSEPMLNRLAGSGRSTGGRRRSHVRGHTVDPHRRDRGG
jgi:3-methyladenine DNA glycosylase AlkD